MNIKTLLILAAILAASPVLAPEALARRGADDPAGHDAGDDNGGTGGGTDDPADHDLGDDNGGGGDDPAGDDNGGGSDDPADHDAGDDNGGDDGSGGSGGTAARARRDLLRDPASPDPDCRGYVEVRNRDGRDRFKVEIEHVDAGLALEVLVEDASGALTTAGSLVAGATGEAELELDTGDGAALPAGASGIGELAGRAVQVRDGSGAVLLVGVVPSLDGAAENLSGVTNVRDGDSGVRAKVRMKVRGKTGRQEFRVDVRKVGSGVAVDLWIDDGSGNLVLADTVSASRGGRGRLRLSTRKGNGMPLGVVGLENLSGRSFELRVDGAVVASGNLPTL